MSTKMGFWRWALASAAILIATGTAGARVIDPTGVTTGEPAGIVLYPRLKVDLNTCVPKGGTFPGSCSLTPTVACSDDDDCQNVCTGGLTCSLTPVIACTTDADCPGAARTRSAADQHLGVPDQVVASTPTPTATAATRRRSAPM